MYRNSHHKEETIFFLHNGNSRIGNATSLLINIKTAPWQPYCIVTTDALSSYMDHHNSNWETIVQLCYLQGISNENTIVLQ